MSDGQNDLSRYGFTRIKLATLHGEKVGIWIRGSVMSTLTKANVTNLLNRVE